MKLKSVALGALALAASGGAMASTAVDVTAATGAFAGVETAVNTIGPAMLLAVAAGIVYKWVAAFLI